MSQTTVQAPATFKSVEVTAFGSPETLAVVEQPTPQPTSGQVRVLVTAATLNPVDPIVRTGAFQAIFPDLTPPFVLGWDLAGVLLDDAGELTAGTRVLAMVPWFERQGGVGGHTELALVDPEWLVATPDGIDDVTAATLPLNALTARQALDLAALEHGQTILITGASGAVGSYAVELAKRDGLTVIAQASSDDEDYVRALGADTVLARSDVQTLVARAGQVDAVLDAANLGVALFDAIRDGGTHVAVTGAVPETDRNITVDRVGVTVDHAQLTELAGLLAAGELTTRVAATYPLAEAAAAHARLEAGGVRGRIVFVA